MYTRCSKPSPDLLPCLIAKLDKKRNALHTLNIDAWGSQNFYVSAQDDTTHSVICASTTYAGIIGKIKRLLKK